MQIEIGHTRKRGQPKKTASALNKQKDYSSSSDSTSSSDSDSDSEPSPVKKVPKKRVLKKVTQKKKPGPKCKK